MMKKAIGFALAGLLVVLALAIALGVLARRRPVYSEVGVLVISAIGMAAVLDQPHAGLSAVLGMSLLMVVMITQYNTRAVSRIVSMMILVTILDRLARPWTARYLQRRSARLARWHRAEGVREDAVIGAG